MLDLFDIFGRRFSAQGVPETKTRNLTGNIEVENIIFVGGTINQLPTYLVHNQNFPLQWGGMPSIPSSMIRKERAHLVTSGVANRVEDYCSPG